MQDHRAPSAEQRVARASNVACRKSITRPLSVGASMLRFPNHYPHHHHIRAVYSQKTDLSIPLACSFREHLTSIELGLYIHHRITRRLHHTIHLRCDVDPRLPGARSIHIYTPHLRLCISPRADGIARLCDNGTQAQALLWRLLRERHLAHYYRYTHVSTRHHQRQQQQQQLLRSLLTGIARIVCDNMHSCRPKHGH